MTEHGGKKLRTDVAVLHAAKVLFERRGLEGVSFDAIAAEAGVSRTTVFNHYPTTARLFAALQAVELEEILSEGRDSGATGLERIAVLLNKLVDDTAAYPHMMTYLTNHLILSREGACLGKLEDLLAQGLQEAGQGDEAACGRLAVMILGQYYGLMNHTHLRNLPFDAARLKAELGEMVSYLFNTCGKDGLQ